jgi:hypothetical protein
MLKYNHSLNTIEILSLFFIGDYYVTVDFYIKNKHISVAYKHYHNCSSKIQTYQNMWKVAQKDPATLKKKWHSFIVKGCVLKRPF